MILNRYHLLLSLLIIIYLMNQYKAKRQKMGAQWLSGRVLDSRRRGRWFEPLRCHCVVSMSKTHLSLLSTGSTQDDQS